MGDTQVVDMLLLGQQDLSWFNSHSEELKSKYNEKFVAFRNKEVVDSDPNLDSLMEKLRKNKVDTTSVMVRFVSRIKSLL
jgi:hypothetical protein